MIGLYVFAGVGLTVYIGYFAYIVREMNRDMRQIDADINAMHRRALERKFHV